MSVFAGMDRMRGRDEDMFARQFAMAQKRRESDMNTSPEIGKKIRDKAVSHVGEHEQPAGSNKGPEVNAYLADVGLPAGNYWCAAAASKWVKDTLQQSRLSIPHVHSASSSAIVNWGKQHGQIIDKAHVQPGDLYILEGGDDKAPRAYDGKPYYHTTVVDFTTPAGVHTIEANYKDSVARNIRAWGIGKFVRPFVV